MQTKLNKLLADTIVADDANQGAKAHFEERVALVKTEARKLRLDREALRLILAPLCATYYPGAEWKKRGESWVFSSGKEGDAAKHCCNRILAAVFETAKRDDVEIPAELLKAAAVLAKLAQQYEGSRSLASKALAAAFSK